ncbi:hypothetical protein [Mesorhizobium sp. B2-3-4]|uniref:hypothetical protein n=1 Tax=Mesorhizobium sp. B2-3-4 TaxID=2589959 RepID=UPI00112E7C35|nr:hypothetical protein [Mesorhizobium sp. B2-3-4]TPM41435.1 hypothetical protein FJ967_00415 [Mesorhizobium sp. B2-3-4]
MGKFLQKLKLPVLVNGSRVMAEITTQNRSLGHRTQDEAPRWLEREYRHFRPHYEIPGFGVIGAVFDHCERWRDGTFKGKFVAFYTLPVSLAGRHGTERVVWVKTPECFYEVRQFTLAHRKFVRV